MEMTWLPGVKGGSKKKKPRKYKAGRGVSTDLPIETDDWKNTSRSYFIELALVRIAEASAAALGRRIRRNSRPRTRQSRDDPRDEKDLLVQVPGVRPQIRAELLGARLRWETRQNFVRELQGHEIKLCVIPSFVRLLLCACHRRCTDKPKHWTQYCTALCKRVSFQENQRDKLKVESTLISRCEKVCYSDLGLEKMLLKKASTSKNEILNLANIWFALVGNGDSIPNKTTNVKETMWMD